MISNWNYVLWRLLNCSLGEPPKQIFGKSWEFGLRRGDPLEDWLLVSCFFGLNTIFWLRWCGPMYPLRDVIPQAQRQKFWVRSDDTRRMQQPKAMPAPSREMGMILRWGNLAVGLSPLPEELAQLPIIPNIKSNYYNVFRLAPQIFHICWTSNTNLKHSRYCEQCDVAFNHI